MNRKLIAVLLILTIIPVSLVSWLWVVNVRSAKDRLRQQVALISKERLTNVDFRIGEVFSRIEKELLQLPAVEELSVDAVRELTRKGPLLRQIFILGHDSLLRYPSPDMVLSEEEKDFLVRTKEIGMHIGLFLKPTGEGEAEMPSVGWYTWYLGEGVNFIFWRTFEDLETGETGIVGMELNRMAVVSEVINALPDTDPESPGEFRIVLQDVNGSVIYQWGGSEEEEGLYESAAIPVSFPLQSWKLRFYAFPENGTVLRDKLVPALSTFSLIILFIIGLAVYLYRESTREIREATQRVTFVNQVSHELKTPLTNIRMYAELLEGRLPEEAERERGYLEVMISESRRLSRLIGNVLTFAGVQKNGLKFNPSVVQANEVVRSVLGNFAPSLDMKHIQIETNLNSGGDALIDRDFLEQILSNLISNVEKYGASGKLLRVETEREGENLFLTVRDKGPGIPKGAGEKVWKPFFRVSNKLTDGVSGTGIGLSIVRTLAKAHGGYAKILETARGTAVQVVLHAPEADS